MKNIIFLLIWFSITSGLTSAGAEKNVQVETLVNDYFIIYNKPLRYTGHIAVNVDKKFKESEIREIQIFIDSVNAGLVNNNLFYIPEKNQMSDKKLNKLIINKGVSDNYRRHIYLSTTFSIGKIQSNYAYITFPASATPTERQKIIRYHILRSLVIYYPSNRLKKLIPGSVFAETDYRKITFNPVDYKILNEIYSAKYDFEPADEKIFKEKMFAAQKRGKALSAFAQISSLILTLMLLVYFYQKGIFKNHRYDFGEYFTQGLTGLLILCFYIFIFILFMIVREHTFPPVYDATFYNFNSVLSLFALLIIGILCICIMYFAEKKFLAETNSYTLAVVIPFLSTAIIPVVFTLSVVLAIFTLLGKGGTPIILLMIFAFGITAAIATVRTLFIILNREAENKIRKKDLEIARMGELHKQAELQSLRAKINPHFLYNSLNSIAGLAHTDPEKTEAMALKLSDFFKYAINREQKQINPLHEELNAIQTYLEIEKVRFGDRLHFEIHCPDALLNVQIPQLIIQPLVENAIKHGTSKITADGFVKIEIRQEQLKIYIRISDNGPAFPDGPISGYGLKNTTERLNLVYGKWAKFRWQNGETKFVELVIPFKKW